MYVYLYNIHACQASARCCLAAKQASNIYTRVHVLDWGWGISVIFLFPTHVRTYTRLCMYHCNVMNDYALDKYPHRWHIPLSYNLLGLWIFHHQLGGGRGADNIEYPCLSALKVVIARNGEVLENTITNYYENTSAFFFYLGPILRSLEVINPRTDGDPG